MLGSSFLNLCTKTSLKISFSDSKHEHAQTQEDKLNTRTCQVSTQDIKLNL